MEKELATERQRSRVFLSLWVAFPFLVLQGYLCGDTSAFLNYELLREFPFFTVLCVHVVHGILFLIAQKPYP